MHLNQNATQRPHIDRQIILDAKQNLWGTIEARLDVLIDLLVAKPIRKREQD